MNSKDTESKEFIILKRVLILILGSGLLGNALYIYGQSYYQGYVERLGFEHTLFALNWSDSIFWAYEASRHIGANLLVNITKYNISYVTIVATIIMSAIYLLLSSYKENSNTSSKLDSRLPRRIIAFRKKSPLTYKYVCRPLIWACGSKKFARTVLAFYSSNIYFVVGLMLLLIWVFFPHLGLSHGEAVGRNELQRYENHLCGSTEDYWSECISFRNPENGELIQGKLIARNDELIGVITDRGPVTFSFPKSYYFETKKNPCFNRESCTDQE